jgi:hypothetical protein
VYVKCTHIIRISWIWLGHSKRRRIHVWHMRRRIHVAVASYNKNKLDMARTFEGMFSLYV